MFFLFHVLNAFEKRGRLLSPKNYPKNLLKRSSAMKERTSIIGDTTRRNWL